MSNVIFTFCATDGVQNVKIMQEIFGSAYLTKQLTFELGDKLARPDLNYLVPQSAN